MAIALLKTFIFLCKRALSNGGFNKGNVRRGCLLFLHEVRQRSMQFRKGRPFGNQPRYSDFLEIIGIVIAIEHGDEKDLDLRPLPFHADSRFKAAHAQPVDADQAYVGGRMPLHFGNAFIAAFRFHNDVISQ